MKVKTSDLPGIGKRYSLDLAEGDHIAMILHQNGYREIYHFTDTDADEPDWTMKMTDEESRQIGAILMGADYQPVSDDRMEMLLKSIRIEWLQVSPQSELAHRRIIDSQIRKKTGVTIIAIQRGDQMIGSPDVNETILPGDVLMVVGNRQQTKGLDLMCHSCVLKTPGPESGLPPSSGPAVSPS
jgi:TrkA domain protein